MRSFFLFLFALFISTNASAQVATLPDTSWHHELIAGMNLSQVSFTHWEAGGTDALAYIASINGKSIHDLPITNWATTYKLAFGQTKLDGGAIRKTDDEINLQSVLTYKLGVHVNPYAALSAITQFAPGYRYTDTAAPVQVSQFLDPAYIQESAGVGFKISPEFQTRLGVALREIITSQYNQYADDPSTKEIEKTKIEGGFESVSELSLPIDDNVLFRAKAALFEPIKKLDKVAIHGDASLVAKISKYFSAQLAMQLINEPEISPFTQIKQGLSLGITYAIF